MTATLASILPTTTRSTLARIARKPWVIVLALVCAYLIYGFASKSLEFDGTNLWAGLPWNWARNVEVGTAGFYLDQM